MSFESGYRLEISVFISPALPEMADYRFVTLVGQYHIYV